MKSVDSNHNIVVLDVPIGNWNRSQRGDDFFIFCYNIKWSCNGIVSVVDEAERRIVVPIRIGHWHDHWPVCLPSVSQWTNNRADLEITTTRHKLGKWPPVLMYRHQLRGNGRTKVTHVGKNLRTAVVFFRHLSCSSKLAQLNLNLTNSETKESMDDRDLIEHSSDDALNFHNDKLSLSLPHTEKNWQFNWRETFKPNAELRLGLMITASRVRPFSYLSDFPDDKENFKNDQSSRDQSTFIK